MIYRNQTCGKDFFMTKILKSLFSSIGKNQLRNQVFFFFPFFFFFFLFFFIFKEESIKKSREKSANYTGTRCHANFETAIYLAFIVFNHK